MQPTAKDGKGKPTAKGKGKPTKDSKVYLHFINYNLTCILSDLIIDMLDIQYMPCIIFSSCNFFSNTCIMYMLYMSMHELYSPPLKEKRRYALLDLTQIIIFYIRLCVVSICTGLCPPHFHSVNSASLTLSHILCIHHIHTHYKQQQPTAKGKEKVRLSRCFL